MRLSGHGLSGRPPHAPRAVSVEFRSRPVVTEGAGSEVWGGWQVETRRLEYFLAVADAKSFTHAAESLFMSQSALSQQIARLEKDLGTVLIDRKARTFTLTVAGVAVYREARRVVEATADLVNRRNDIRSGRLGRLRIGIVPSALFTSVPALIAQYTERYAEVDVTVTQDNTSDLYGLLKDRRLDVAFSYSQSELEGLVFQSVESGSHVAAVHVSHPLAEFEEIRLRQLKDQKLLLVARPGAPEVHDTLVSACRAVGFSPSLGGAENASYIDEIAYVAANQGIAIIPELLSFQLHPAVVFKQLIEPEIPYTLGFAVRGEELDPTVQNFAEFILEAGRAGSLRL